MADITMVEVLVPVLAAVASGIVSYAVARNNTNQKRDTTVKKNEQFFSEQIQELFAMQKTETQELKQEVHKLRVENEQLKNEIRKLLGELQCYRHIVEGDGDI